MGAGSGELAVPKASILQARVVLGPADALDAEGTLLHYTSSPYRHVRIELEIERLRPGHVVVLVPVEVPHLIGTIVGAISGPYAAIVDLAIEPVGSVVGRIHRAHRLTGGIATVLAQHRDETG